MTIPATQLLKINLIDERMKVVTAGMLQRSRSKGSKEDLETGWEGEGWRESEGARHVALICCLESLGSLVMGGASLSWKQRQGVRGLCFLGGHRARQERSGKKQSGSIGKGFLIARDG